MTNKELEWFDIETRLRKVVMEMLEPTLQKITVDRENSIKLKRKQKSAIERLFSVESLLGLGSTKSGWMLEIEKKLQESAVEYFMFKSSTTQQIKNLVDFSESLQLNLDNLKSCSDGIQQRLVAKDIEISSLHASLNSNKNVMMGYFENTKEDLTKTYNEIMEASRESQKIADDALRKSTTVTLRQKEIEGSIEKNLVLIKDVLCQISKVSQEKASIVDLRTEAKTLQKGIDQINERSGQIEVSVLELIRYLDTYIPVDIQVAVSDNLYSYLDARPLKKFWRFEEERRKQLQKRTTDFENACDLQGLMKRSVEAGRRAEKRTEDYKNDIVRTRGENKLASPTPSSHGSSTLRNYDYKASINTSRKGISMIEEESDEEISLSSKDLHEIKTTMSEVYDLKQKLADVLQREQKIREDMRTGDEENKIYLDMMQNEVEDTKRKTKNDSELFDSEIWSMKTELENQTTSNQKKEGIIKNISELVAALVEFDLIAQALISQDEESRTMNTHVKPVEISSQNLPVITPRRIATAAIDNPLQSNSFQSLKQPTIQPSYKYRNKLYTRNELLDIWNQLIHEAWENASSKPPFVSELNSLPTSLPRTRSKHIRMSSGSSKIIDPFTRRSSKRVLNASFVF